MLAAACFIIEILSLAPALAAEPNFSASDVLNGIVSTPSDCGGPGKTWVEVDGHGDCLRFYGTIPDGSPNRPVIFLEGDAVQRNGKTDAGQTVWSVPPYYTQLSPSIMQAEAEQYAAATHRPFINLARPGIYGSSGNHLQRRRKREVDLVNAAVDRLKDRFGWNLISLAGQSGGGHLVGALLARRRDVDCAVIASGNVAVRRRLQELGLAADVTGFTDFIDPVDDVDQVARHPPRTVIMLTDPMDAVVTASSQRVFSAALRRAGVTVDQRYVTAPDAWHHQLRIPAILAALACQ
jgi:hypothetical protein